MSEEVGHALMSTDQHADDVPGHAGADAHHEITDHGDDHGHDDHAHEEEALGPINWAAWGAGALGIAIGVAIAFCFALATSTSAVT
jgi:ABC-type Zn2+ transport system substrate-binding protein/surface adhesin